MARTKTKLHDLATIDARRETLRAELASLDEQAHQAQEAARDAGRPTFIAALERVRIAAMDKADAKTIATAIGQHGGKIVAQHLSSIPAE